MNILIEGASATEALERIADAAEELNARLINMTQAFAAAFDLQEVEHDVDADAEPFRQPGDTICPLCRSGRIEVV